MRNDLENITLLGRALGPNHRAQDERRDAKQNVAVPDDFVVGQQHAGDRDREHDHHRRDRKPYAVAMQMRQRGVFGRRWVFAGDNPLGKEWSNELQPHEAATEHDADESNLGTADIGDQP